MRAGRVWSVAVRSSPAAAVEVPFGCRLHRLAVWELVSRRDQAVGEGVLGVRGCLSGPVVRKEGRARYGPRYGWDLGPRGRLESMVELEEVQEKSRFWSDSAEILPRSGRRLAPSLADLQVF